MDPVYNTLMAIPAGLAVVMLALMGRRLANGQTIHRYAWAAAYGALGFILTLLGAVMTLTCPRRRRTVRAMRPGPQMAHIEA